ncbi:MAG: 23S rRNA (guanosine2251-2'-O)-methyltransferase [Planctomycetota bacterium]|jgi:23S rRNA (guanosine2251-2'-O)-methyltransferase
MAKNKAQFIYGMHTARLALEQSPSYILEVSVQKDKKLNADLAKLIELANTAGIKVHEVSREFLDNQTDNALHQGILVKQKSGKRNKHADLDALLASNNGALLLLILDGVQDPHNLGACLRTANAAGVDAVLLSKDRSVAVNATVSKVASGGAENTSVITVSNIARTLRQLQEAGVWIVGTAADVEKSLYDVDLTVSTAIVMGSEGKGLRQNTREHCDHLVKLPMQGVVESLNVSVATGVCLYEALRQRTFQQD